MPMRAAVEAELAKAGMCRETREVWAPTIPRGGITEVSSSYKPLLARHWRCDNTILPARPSLRLVQSINHVH